MDWDTTGAPLPWLQCKSRKRCQCIVSNRQAAFRGKIQRSVAEFLASLHVPSVRASLYSGDIEPLLARAEEVWGMTTIALNVALAAGKTVRSFQPHRTLAGVEASNPPY